MFVNVHMNHPSCSPSPWVPKYDHENVPSMFRMPGAGEAEQRREHVHLDLVCSTRPHVEKKTCCSLRWRSSYQSFTVDLVTKRESALCHRGVIPVDKIFQNVLRLGALLRLSSLQPKKIVATRRTWPTFIRMASMVCAMERDSAFRERLSITVMRSHRALSVVKCIECYSASCVAEKLAPPKLPSACFQCKRESDLGQQAGKREE